MISRLLLTKERNKPASTSSISIQKYPRRRSALAYATVAIAACAGSANALSFPSHPITIVVPFSAGGASDALTRIIGSKLSERVKQPVIVDNRPGGGGQIGAMFVKQAAADGYTLFLASSGTHATNRALYADLPYDPDVDFTPVVRLVRIAQLLVVPAGSPAKSVADLIAKAKADPGKTSFGSQSVGSGGHIGAEILRSKNDLDLNHIPYKGSAPALVDLVAGRIDFMFDAVPSSMPFVKDGRLRALAIDAKERTPLLPNVPTLLEQGFKEHEASPWLGLVAPANTPDDVIEKLQTEVNSILNDPEVRSQITTMGLFIMGGTSKEFDELIEHDAIRLGKIVKESGVKKN